MVQVAAMFALPLLALSLAIPPKRSTSALGVFLSIVIIVTYHKINEYAEQMGALGRINPWLALWVPYVFFCAFCYWMFQTLAKPRSEEHTSELQSLMRISYAVFCLKKKNQLHKDNENKHNTIFDIMYARHKQETTLKNIYDNNTPSTLSAQ